VADLITSGGAGFASDNLDELRGALRRLLDDWDYARALSQAGREAAIACFGKAAVKAQWSRFFSSIS
jgi:hypothetical protein